MGLFSFFKRKGNVNHTFNAEDRDLSLELRKQNAELKKKQNEYNAELMRLEHERKKLELQSQIDEIRETLDESSDYEEDNPESTEQILLKMFAPVIMQKMNIASPSMNVTPSSPKESTSIDGEKTHLSEQTIYTLWNYVPVTYKSLLRNKSESDLKQIVKSYILDIDDDSLYKVISLIKSQ